MQHDNIIKDEILDFRKVKWKYFPIWIHMCCVLTSCRFYMSIKNISLGVAVYLNTSISLGEVVYIAKNICTRNIVLYRNIFVISYWEGYFYYRPALILYGQLTSPIIISTKKLVHIAMYVPCNQSSEYDNYWGYDIIICILKWSRRILSDPLVRSDDETSILHAYMLT